MVCYQKDNGIAHDIRLVADDYVPAPGEILVKGDRVPSQDALSDLSAVASRDASIELGRKRAAALRALEDARLSAAISDPNAPQAVKDYAAASARP